VTLAQVRPDLAPLLLALLLVFLGDQHFFDPGINLFAVLPAEFDSRAGLQKLVDLWICQILGMPHCDVHSQADCPPRSSHFQDHLALESNSVSGSSCIG